MLIKEYDNNDINSMIEIWNEVVEDGLAFPQMTLLTSESGLDFFAKQDFVGVAKEADKIVGLYILHPNNEGRCGHQANASYAVKRAMRGQKIGEQLVIHSLNKTKELGYSLMIFNAVVRDNKSALHLYQKLGFQQVGIIPKGFLLKNGKYQDIIVHY